jgi:predicted nucleic acid-binding protein
VLVLDSGGVSRLAARTRQALALIQALREEGLWPPRVPSVVLVECLQGHAGRDANENRFLKTCDVTSSVPEALARRAAQLRRLARRGSAVDALVVASAEPGGTVLTSDPKDLEALATHARDVAIVVV